MKKNKKPFHYISNGRRHSVRDYSFRVGDLVKVMDWGGIYTSYTNAFRTFIGNPYKPYYCEHEYQRKLAGHKRLFKVMDVAEHESFDGEMLCYIIDNERRGAVVGADYLKPHKVYPLRSGESYDITPKRIKID